MGQEIPGREETFNRTINPPIFTVTRGERTGGILLAHVETSEELDPEVRVNHVVHLDQII